MNTDKMPSQPVEIKKERPRVVYHGPARIGDGIEVQCAVLDDGRRGYISRTLQEAIGFKDKNRSGRFAAFVAEIAPKPMKENGESEWPIEVVMPHGGIGHWTEAGILTDVASGVIGAALEGNLHASRRHLVAPCHTIMKALAKTGEVALIDEATGYQYHRAPDALQDLFTRLIRQTASDWERRFHPEYYRALCKLFGINYGNQHRVLPGVIGQITLNWIYEVIFPPEILAEVKRRKKSEKLHQWLTKDGGLALLEKQRDAVMMIARSSVDYPDFQARCSVAFYKPGQQTALVYPH